MIRTIPLRLLASLLFLCLFSCTQAQEPATRPHCQQPAFDAAVASLINFSVPLIGVKELQRIQSDVVLFDAREKEEYEVSHIAGAKYLGYKKFDPTTLANVDKDQKIVLYCSVGYRSEKIGERLLALGYTNVYNLYGSIFEWINQGNPVVDEQGKVIQKVHTYNKKWSQWVEEGKVKKVW